MAQNFIANLLRRNKNEEELPYITPIQLDENGKIDPIKSANLELKIKQDSTPLTINERLFGRDMTQDYQTINPETKKVEMATLTNHRPGFFEDFGRGYRENATQGFNVNNLVPVENKGLATRLGEGLGTIERFANTPLGRGLIAYGLSNAIDMARDAIELTMVTLEDNNMPVPVASDEKELCKMDGMFSSEGYTMLSLVDADSTNYRRKEYNYDIDCYVQLPKWLDFEARSAGINISSVLQDALISKLGIAQ